MSHVTHPDHKTRGQTVPVGVVFVRPLSLAWWPLKYLSLAEVSLHFHVNSLRMSRHIKLLQPHKLIHRSSSSTVKPTLRQFIFFRSAVIPSFCGCSKRSCSYFSDISLACRHAQIKCMSTGLILLVSSCFLHFRSFMKMQSSCASQLYNTLTLRHRPNTDRSCFVMLQ